MATRKKRSQEETAAAVQRAQEAVANGSTVADALKAENLQQSSWYKYKKKAEKKEKLAKKAPIVSDVQPIKLTGTKTMFVITDDPEVIERMMEKLK